MTNYSQLLLYFFLHGAGKCLQEPRTDYSGASELEEAAQVAQFVRDASALRLSPPPPREIVRITRDYRIYIGREELKLRPMAKAVLLLFLRHPEGIALKHIGDHRAELTRLYSRVSRSDDSARIGKSIDRVLDIFSNELNVNLSRVNAALQALEKESRLRIDGRAGASKTLEKEGVILIWE